jgi:hypothetical protein
MNQEILIDGHVHIHPHFSLERLLDCAHANLLQRASTANSVFCLLLAESGAADCFAQLSQFPAHNRGNWRIEPGGESGVLRAIAEDGRSIYLYAGRQLVSRDNIEVLALMTDATIEDGQSLHDINARVRSAGGLVALPWGFGKWLGARGKRVSRCLTDDGFQLDFIGDNGMRLSALPEPFIFRQARTLGIRILPGSDPFPFAGEEQRAGTAGLRLYGDFDHQRPLLSLHRTLLAPWHSPHAFRSPPSIARFAGLQLRMQWHKRSIGTRS